MSGTGEVTADFAGEERAFRLRLGELRRIEDRCGGAIGDVAQRLARALTVLSQLKGIDALVAGLNVHADDVREVIHQGLLGAGMPSSEVTPLLRREIDDRGLPGVVDNVNVALRVLVGAQEAPDTGEPRAGASPATAPSGSTSASSSALAPPSDGLPARSKPSQRGSSSRGSKAGSAPTA